MVKKFWVFGVTVDKWPDQLERTTAREAGIGDFFLQDEDMSGGKFLLNDETVPDHIVFPRSFQDLHLGWRDASPRMLQWKETYEDMLWLMIRHTIANRKSWNQDACLTEVISRPLHRFFLDLDLLFAKEHESVQAWNAFVRKVCIGVRPVASPRACSQEARRRPTQRRGRKQEVLLAFDAARSKCKHVAF